MKAIIDSSLIFWLSCYLCGIVCGQVDMLTWLIPSIGLGVYLLVVLLGVARNMHLYFLFGSLLFLLGGWSMNLPEENHLLINGEHYYIGQIEQCTTTDKSWNANIVRLRMIRSDKNKWAKCNDRVMLLIEKGSVNEEQTFRKNDLLLFKTNFQECNRATNPGEFDAANYWRSKGVRYQGFGANQQVSLLESVPLGWFDLLLDVVRKYSSDMLERWIGSSDAPLLKALLLGDKSDLDVEIKRIFMNTGAMHMLAVSGMHVGLIVVVLEGFFKTIFFRRGKKVSSWLMVCILWFYAFLTGFSASVTRAVVMFTVLILSSFLKRGYQGMNSLCIAAFFILVVNPLAIFDIGFQLSFLAMVGIFTVYPMLQTLFVSHNSLLNTIWQGTAVGLAAQVFTLPLSVYYFHQFPNYFMLTNIGVMLFSGVLLGLSIGLLAVGKVSLLSTPIGWIVAVCSSVFIGFIAFVETLPGALAVGFSSNKLWVVAMYCVIVIGLYWAQRQKWTAILLSIIPVLLWIQIERMHNVSVKEWVLFNHKHTIILFNNAGHQVCLYENTPQNRKQAYRMVENYQKIHPGTSEFYPIVAKKYRIQVADKEFQLSFTKEYSEITTPTQSFSMVLSDNAIVDSLFENTKIISKNNEHRNTFYQLENGAYREAI